MEKRFVIEVEVPPLTELGRCPFNPPCPLSSWGRSGNYRCEHSRGEGWPDAFKPGPLCPRHSDYAQPVDRLAEATEILRDWLETPVVLCGDCGRDPGPDEACAAEGCPNAQVEIRARRFLEALEGRVESE